jgi:chromosome segregation protein
MMTISAGFDQKLRQYFSNVIQVEDGVLRGEKRSNGNVYAVSYFDLHDNVVARAESIRKFQEHILGSDFYSSTDQLRWSNYLYLVAGPNSLSHPDYQQAKLLIEADRDYARKLVLTESELLERISDPKVPPPGSGLEATNVINSWAIFLESNGLGALVGRPTRVKALEMIETGSALGAIGSSHSQAIAGSDLHLASSAIQSLSITGMNGLHHGRPFNFADVNLISGPNGSGKTTLLEAIELLYCGANRRERPSSEFGVKATMKKSGGGEYGLTPPTEAARIKARNLSWYRRDDPLSKRILDSFTLYNFLDTDAAFRISTELDQQKLNEHLNRLLIGTEASLLWQYLGKVEDDVDSRLVDYKRKIEVQIQKRDLLKAELVRLKGLPSAASTLERNFHASAKVVGWKRTRPASLPLAAEERAELENAIRALQRACSQEPGTTQTLATLRNRTTFLEGILVEASAADAARVLAQARLTDIEKLVVSLRMDISVLEELAGYWDVGFPQKAKELIASQKKNSEVRTLIGHLASDPIDSIPVGLESVPVAAAQRKYQSELIVATSNRANLEARRKASASLEETIAAVRQQLKNAALHLIAHSADPGSCPVCQTAHEPSDLLAKIEALEGAGIGNTLAQLDDDIERVGEEVSRSQAALSALKSLQEICMQFGLDADSVTGGAAISKLREARANLADAKAKMHDADQAIQTLLKGGFTEEKFLAGIAYSEEREWLEDGELDVSRLIAARAAIEVQQAAVTRAQKDAQDEIAKAVARLQGLHRGASLDPLAASVTDGILPEIRLIVADAADSLAQVNGLASNLNLETNASLLGTCNVLQRLLEEFDVALHAVESESLMSQELAVGSASVEEAESTLKVSEDRFARVSSAKKALSELRRDLSIDAATADVLTMVREQVNDVFGRIHTPREFDFSTENAHLLVTRKGSKARSLDEISTGQRAAFALSIFLALSSTATSSPRVLLIDDPVAHVDDLNALSFLDYLRELAIHSKRQIFFATADTRLATLCEKKFAFLGDGFTRIQLEGRADNV